MSWLAGVAGFFGFSAPVTSVPNSHGVANGFATLILESRTGGSLSLMEGPNWGKLVDAAESGDVCVKAVPTKKKQAASATNSSRTGSKLDPPSWQRAGNRRPKLALV